MSYFPLDLGDNIPGCPHFRWTEVLWLPSWGIHVFPKENEFDNLIKTTQKLELIREIIGCPLRITSGLRPAAYNKQIGGAPFSLHQQGLALDFAPRDPQLSADDVRLLLVGELESLDVRMERLPRGSHWVHIDLGESKRSGRYFYP